MVKERELVIAVGTLQAPNKSTWEGALARRGAKLVAVCAVNSGATQCKGCGSCVAACPNAAMQQRGFTDRQVLSMVEALVS